MFVQLLSNTTVVSHSCVVECFRKLIAIATSTAFISLAAVAVAVVILRQIYLKKKRSYNW